MKLIKIGAAVIAFLSMATSSFITVNAEDSTTNNLVDDSQNNINIEEPADITPETENGGDSEPVLDAETEQSTDNNVSSEQPSVLQNSALKAGAVNQYGFDPDFFQWLIDNGELPRSGVVTQADLDKVTRIDDIINAPFSSLEGIEQFKNLNFLRINSCENISYTELNRLKDLTNLRTLEVGYSKLMTDISPVADLPQLTTLNWYDNGGYVINYTYYYGAPLDISVLSGKLPNIQSLSITEIPLLGTEALTTFTTAETVNLWSTGIKNIDFIQSMPNLTYLDVRYDKVTDLSLVAARPAVQTLADGQLIVRYGDETLFTDLTNPSTFDTSMYFKVSDGQYAPLTGISTDKGSYDGVETVTWTDITAADLQSVTYNDPFAMQKIPLKTVASQFKASSLPANVISYSGTIYQAVSQKVHVDAPVIDIIYEDETTLSGTAPAGMEVDIFCPHGHTIKVTADASGAWSMTTDGVIKKDEIFTAVTVLPSGQKSDVAEQIVKPVTYTIDANDVTMTVSQLQTLRQSGDLESYVLEQAHATATKLCRTKTSLTVHGDMTPLANVNEATVVQVTTYVPADATATTYDANNTLVEKQINVTVTADAAGATTDNNNSLPNTGQELIVPTLIGGAAITIAGIVLSKKNNKQRK